MTKFSLKLVGGALAASLLMASHANAGGGSKDLGAYGPAIWAGFYAGAHLGIGYADWELSSGPVSIEGSDTDLIGGVQVGYNFLSGSTLYGVEADWSFLNGHGGTIRGRFGQVMDNMLLYATAGVAFRDDDTVDTTGFVIGGGVEFDLSHRWKNVTAGIEGLYSGFSDDASCSIRINSTNYGCGYNADVDSFVVRGRVNFHFGEDIPAPLK